MCEVHRLAIKYNVSPITVSANILHKKSYHKKVVEAGFKDLLKKGALFLTGVVFSAQSAFGLNLNVDKLKIYENSIKKVMKEYTQESGGEDTYDFKIATQQKGGIQQVKFNVIKNGKVAGQVTFLGTQSDTFNSVKTSLSEDGKDDTWVREVVDSQASHVAKMIHDSK